VFSSNNDLINKISTILFLLKIEEKTVERILEVYERRLDDNLKKFGETLDKEKAEGTKFQAVDNYKFAFSQMFVDYLGYRNPFLFLPLTLSQSRILVELIDQYKENAIDHIEKPELFHVVEKLANYKAKEFLSKKFIPTFQQFFNLDAPNIEHLSDRMQIDNAIDFSAWMNPTNQVGKHKDNVHAIETFCEEISEISNQCERFKKYLASMFVEAGDQSPDKILAPKRSQSKTDKEKKEIDPNFFLDRINKLNMPHILVDLLDKFIYYQKVTLVRSPFYISQPLNILNRNSRSFILFKIRITFEVFLL